MSVLFCNRLRGVTLLRKSDEMKSIATTTYFCFTIRWQLSVKATRPPTHKIYLEIDSHQSLFIFFFALKGVVLLLGRTVSAGTLH